MSRSTYAFALLAVAAALAIAGCGSSSSGGGYGNKGGDSSAADTTGASSGGAYAAPVESAPGAESGAAIVSLASTPKLGLILVESNGFTLYDFHKDNGAQTSCYGACARVWPPLLSEGDPQVGNGAAAAKLGTTERSDGSTQVTYAGHPLYTYAADRRPGEANGNDFSSFGAQWYALKGSGQEAGG